MDENHRSRVISLDVKVDTNIIEKGHVTKVMFHMTFRYTKTVFIELFVLKEKNILAILIYYLY